MVSSRAGRRVGASRESPPEESGARRVRSRISPDPGDEEDSSTILLHGGPALPAALVAQWRDGKLCDVMIRVEGEALMAQRAILAGSSGYFAGLFIGGGVQMADGAQQVELQEMCVGTMRCVLDWIYEGTCTVPRNALFDLLAAASRLQIDSLQLAAAWAIVGRVLDDSTCLETWELASRLSVAPLEEQAEQYALERFAAVSRASDLRTLPVERLTRLLASDLLMAEEEEVLEVLFAWAHAHEPSPAVLAQQLSLVRFDLFRDPGTARRASTAPILASRECMTVLAQKLADQVDPAVAGSTARRAADEYTSPSPSDLQVAHHQKMRRVANECMYAARFAQYISEQSPEGFSKVVGPASMFVVAKRMVFEPLLMRVLHPGAQKAGPKSLHRLFVNVSNVEWQPPDAILQGVRLTHQSGGELSTPPARPPARELYRFVPREMHGSVLLAWADEVVDVDAAFMCSSDQLEVSTEQATIRVRNALSDAFDLPYYLLCSCILPEDALLAMHAYIRIGEEEEAPNGALIGKIGRASIVMPGFVAALKPALKPARYPGRVLAAAEG